MPILEFIDEPIYEHGFPWRNHSEQELLDEFRRIKKIIKRPPCDQPYPFSISGYKYSNFFFQYERMNTPGRGTRGTTVKFWNTNKERMINYSIREKRDLFGQLNFFNHAPAQFPPVVAGKVYNLFKATKIFDPYAGWEIVV